MNFGVGVVEVFNKNVMTNEQQIEEILTEASAFGLRWEVQSTAEQIMDENPNLDKVEAYQQAFSEWVK
jgi:hypothetical protein